MIKYLKYWLWSKIYLQSFIISKELLYQNGMSHDLLDTVSPAIKLIINNFNLEKALKNLTN